MRHRRGWMLMALVWVASGCEPGELTLGEVSFLDDPTLADSIVAAGLWVADGIEVIGDDEFLFADRGGQLYHYVEGRAEALGVMPTTRVSSVYGGVLDVSLHPRFAQNGWVYVAYNDRDYDLTVARFELRNGSATGFTPLWSSNEFSIGSRIEWEDDSTFFLSFGIGGDPFPDPGPQDLSMDVGKIHRLLSDGSVPSDNPIFDGATGPTSVWSYGHRNPQGLHYDPVEARLWATEHGPLGGDELNVVEAGANYGWPLFSYGLNYDRSDVSALTEAEALATTEGPVAYWGPNDRVAPSSLTFVGDGVLAGPNPSFLIGALFSQDLVRYDPTTGETEVVLRNVGRVRDIASLPSGDVLLAIDAASPDAAAEGRIVRITRVE